MQKTEIYPSKRNKLYFVCININIQPINNYKLVANSGNTLRNTDKNVLVPE